MKKRVKKQDYNGAVVLGLNDALVELSGALVGFTFALSEPKTIAIVGLITGFAAALSMAASEYLSAKEDKIRRPVKAATYTGIAYIIAVLILVSPYFILKNAYLSTAIMFLFVIAIIAGFTKYDSYMHKEKFSKKFIEMFAITLTVSIISFLFASVVKRLE